MPTSQTRKNKIAISDYNYTRDIENRLLMADLSVFEVNVLREILDSSLKVSISNLADTLETSKEKVIAVIDKLSVSKLLARQGDHAIVDKEMRKYYESQILKFDEDFEPGMEYLQSLLNKVPIHVLPVWYSITKSTDSIFSCIIEKYFATPKIYENYLQELIFDDSILDGIMKDLFASPDLQLSSKWLLEKYGLNREQFELCMLMLEYNLVCCLSYSQKDAIWEEVVTPFHEWKEYLTFQVNTIPKKISEVESITRFHSKDFGYVHDTIKLLNVIEKNPLKVQQVNQDYTLFSDDAKKLFRDISDALPIDQYAHSIIEKLMLAGLVEVQNDELIPTTVAKKWLTYSLQDQALTLFRLPFQSCTPVKNLSKQFIDKDLREAERSIKRAVNKGWVYFDDFMKGLTAHIGDAEPITLKNKGKRWKYQVPQYDQEEQILIEATLFERLFPAGMIIAGMLKNKRCFIVTPFGRMTLGE